MDSAHIAYAAGGLLAVQHRGRAGATLGEVRTGRRSPFWGMDSPTLPRFMARYVDRRYSRARRRGGRTSSVSAWARIPGEGSRSYVDDDPSEEITALSLMRASVQGYTREQKSPE